MKTLNQISISFCLTLSLVILSCPLSAREYEKADPPRELTAEQSERAEANYQRYCSLCHGKDREGHANDHAPSLRSKSLFESGTPHSILRPLAWGREGTAMGGYLEDVGGPLTMDEAWDLTYWLFWQSGAERIRLTEDPVTGDVAKGEVVYQENCASCHGAEGEGITAPALGNASALAHNKDEFIRYAIEKGREGTPMVSFSGQLSVEDIDNVTAFIRSRATGWTAGNMKLREIPTPEEYVLNPDGEDPGFDLSEDHYITSAELFAALESKKRIVLLDTRVTSVWQRAHIEGSVPFPYYTDLEDETETLPKDVQIVGYCSCPRAASDYIMSKLEEIGYTKTAVLYEGIFGWMNQGYPVTRNE